MRIGAVLGRIALLVASIALGLTVADGIVRIGHLDFRPIRSRPNDDSVLEQSEFRTRVVTNALGFRDPRLPGPKPPGTVRVVVLGDSFTQGYGVQAEQAYPRLLERLLDARAPGRRHEVINLGVPGACTLDYVAHLREVGLRYEPDLVLVGLMANDVNDVHGLREYGARIMPQVLNQVQDELVDDHRPAAKEMLHRLWPSLYVYVSQRLHGLRRQDATAHAVQGNAGGAQRSAAPTPAVSEDRWKDVLLGVATRYGRRPQVEAALAVAPPETIASLRSVLTGHYRYDATEQLPMLRLAALVHPRAMADMLTLPPPYDDAWEETTRLLRRIDELARGAGARTMLAFLPASVQVSPEIVAFRQALGFEGEAALLDDDTIGERLGAFGAGAGIPVVDLLPALRSRRDEALYYPIDGHWTPLGHEIAAEVLAAAIAAG